MVKRIVKDEERGRVGKIGEEGGKGNERRRSY